MTGVQMQVNPLSEHLVRVAFVGRLDTPAVDRIETRFVDALGPGANNAIVDLSEVNFVASMAIRMLVSAARNLRTRQATLAIYGAQDSVKRVFEAVALAKILPICSTEAEALAAVAPPGN